MDRIIFLDIDGPMIPYVSFLFDKHASLDQVLDDRCVKVLHLILKKSRAKIVFNSYHNNYFTEGLASSKSPGLLRRFQVAGFGDHIHPTQKTLFPYGADGRSKLSRLDAIRIWLGQNGNHNWVVLDDEHIEHERAYRVNPEYGIGMSAYQHCAEWLWHNPGRKEAGTDT